VSDWLINVDRDYGHDEAFEIQGSEEAARQQAISLFQEPDTRRVWLEDLQTGRVIEELVK
jgi:hypothetical protein